MAEHDFIERLRAIATHPAARGLADDAAVLGNLVLTHDMIVEGVHYLPTDPPADVAWKLLAVNLSDLAAKGAVPEGVLLGYPLGAADWDAAFVDGLAMALRHFDVPLLGGDTVSAPEGAPRMIGLTALGRSAYAPDRRHIRALGVRRSKAVGCRCESAPTQVAGSGLVRRARCRAPPRW